MKQEFIYTKGDMYGPSENYWAFVKKVKKGYEALASLQSCKDYMHDALANVVQQSRVTTSSGYSKDSDINLKHLQFAMFFARTPGKKKQVYSTKFMLNLIEQQNSITPTEVVEISAGKHKDNYQVFIFKADKIYLESPTLMHGMVAFLRTMHMHKGTKFTTLSNIKSVLGKDAVKDTEVLRYVVKHNIMDVLMENHNEIFKDLTLKDVYPTKVTNPNGSSYHGGFGMVALARDRLACLEYSNRINKVLKDNKIPFM